MTCYRNKFNELGIVPEDIQSLSDLTRLPFTTKEDLRLNYPYGMFAVRFGRWCAFILLRARPANPPWSAIQNMI